MPWWGVRDLLGRQAVRPMTEVKVKDCWLTTTLYSPSRPRRSIRPHSRPGSVTWPCDKVPACEMREGSDEHPFQAWYKSFTNPVLFWYVSYVMCKVILEVKLLKRAEPW